MESEQSVRSFFSYGNGDLKFNLKFKYQNLLLASPLRSFQSDSLRNESLSSPHENSFENFILADKKLFYWTILKGRSGGLHEDTECANSRDSLSVLTWNFKALHD